MTADRLASTDLDPTRGMEALTMRLPRFQFTIRRMIVAVAVVATVFGVELMRRRRNDCLREAMQYEAFELRALDAIERRERQIEQYLKEHPTATEESRGMRMHRKAIAHLRDQADSSRRRRLGYQVVASRPWLPAPRKSQTEEWYDSHKEDSGSECGLVIFR
jgi:hypothetical protein